MPIEIKYTPALEAGTYEARVTAVEERVNKDGQPYRWWQFTTEDGGTVSAISSMNVGPRSKAGQWIAALIGRQPAQGESVEVIGAPCLIGVAVNEDGFSEITSVLGRTVKPRKQTATAEAIANSEGTKEAAAIHAVQEEDQLPF